ncbi:S49 family peptidase [Candidatus Dependentiae bacterium]|nr:S49 family peptidase [Candidatus Dependentiae bacterium]
MSLFNLLKNILLLLILIRLAPALLEGIEKEYKAYLKPKAKIGLVSLKGDINDATAPIQALNMLFKDKEIKGILMILDSAETAAGTAQAIHNEIKALKHHYQKPVGVLVENNCTSGGYYIACIADFIVAPGMALIGKIDGCMSPDTPLPQELVDDAYQQFVADVATNRHLARSQSTQWADGKLFSGKKAVTLGLVDALGSEYDALQIMKKRALIEGDIAYVSIIDYNPSIIDSLYASLQRGYTVFMSR